MTTNLNQLTITDIFYRIAAMPPGQKKDAAKAYALKRWGSGNRFQPFINKPWEYIKIFLKWEAWTGLDEEHPGQLQILEACALVMRQQEEKDKWEKGLLKESELTVWKPGQTIQNWIRVESGNGIGKTKASSGILNWFLDCFVPSAIFTYAPGGDQARFVIWSEIRGDRTGKGLPGRILETEIKIDEKHFAAHRTISIGNNRGEERAKGKHEAYQLFILDEADGIDDVIYDSIVSQTSGGKNLVIMFANPKSRTSMFHRVRTRSYVQTFRISTLYHPNVREGYEVIPNAVRRDFVEKKIENDCEILHSHHDEDCNCRQDKCNCYKLNGSECDGTHKKIHKEDDFTFDVPYKLIVGGETYLSGSIFKPNGRFMTDILGITPPNSTDRTVIPSGRYDAAVKRREIEYTEADELRATFGIDVATWGADKGTLYVRWKNEVWRAAEFLQQDSKEYFHTVKEIALDLAKKGVKKLHIRIDVGGGNTGLLDTLKHNLEIREAFQEFKVIGVQFGSSPYDKNSYADLVTEMYFEAKETIQGIRMIDPPETLEGDLTLREWEPVNRQGKELKKLEDKIKSFRKRLRRSPDDGDGFVLCVAPDYCFKIIELVKPLSVPKKSIWD